MTTKRMARLKKAIRELEKQIRVLTSSVERKMQLVIKDDHPVMAWIPQHAGFLLSLFQVAADGKTAGRNDSVAAPAEEDLL